MEQPKRPSNTSLVITDRRPLKRHNTMPMANQTQSIRRVFEHPGLRAHIASYLNGTDFYNFIRASPKIKPCATQNLVTATCIIQNLLQDIVSSIKRIALLDPQKLLQQLKIFRAQKTKDPSCTISFKILESMCNCDQLNIGNNDKEQNQLETIKTIIKLRNLVIHTNIISDFTNNFISRCVSLDPSHALKQMETHIQELTPNSMLYLLATYNKRLDDVFEVSKILKKDSLTVQEFDYLDQHKDLCSLLVTIAERIHIFKLFLRLSGSNDGSEAHFLFHCLMFDVYTTHTINERVLRTLTDGLIQLNRWHFICQAFARMFKYAHEKNLVAPNLSIKIGNIIKTFDIHHIYTILILLGTV